LNKNEDKIKDVESTEVSVEILNEKEFYSEDIPPKVAFENTLFTVIEKRLNKLELKNARYKDNSDMRKALVVAFTTIIALWLLSVLLILVGNTNRYHLSENTLITFLTTSSANVLGMMYVILKNLFPEKNKKDKTKTIEQ
jgi:hypothetical protein